MSWIFCSSCNRASSYFTKLSIGKNNIFLTRKISLPEKLFFNKHVLSATTLLPKCVKYYSISYYGWNVSRFSDGRREAYVKNKILQCYSEFLVSVANWQQQPNINYDSIKVRAFIWPVMIGVLFSIICKQNISIIATIRSVAQEGTY